MPAPVRTSISFGDYTLLVVYDQPLDENNPPLPSDYSITLNGVPLLPNSAIVLNVPGVGGGNGRVYIGTTNRGYPGIIGVDFTAGRLRNPAGELAPGFTGLQVNNNTTATDTIAPALVDQRVNAAQVFLYFNEVLDPTGNASNVSFSVSRNGLGDVVTARTIYGTRLALTLTDIFDADDAGGLAYAQPGIGGIRDIAGNYFPSLSYAILLTNVTQSTGYYAARTDIEDWFGIDNAAAWSQLDNDVAAADEKRIARALAFADRQIDRELRTAGYSTPIATTSADFKLLTDIAAEMAGVWLYLARGKQDLGGGETGAAMAGKMDDHRKHADDELTDLIADGIDGAARFTDTSGAPLQIVAGNSGANGLAADGLPLGSGWCG